MTTLKKTTTNASSAAAYQTPLSQIIESFFNGSYPYASAAQNQNTQGYTPAINITENAKQVTVTAELPGLTKDDIDVTVDNNKLVIKGEKTNCTTTESQDASCIVQEATYGSFQRTVSLNNAIDTAKVTSTYKQGILEVTLPKKAETIQNTKKVAVTEKK